MGMVLVFGDRDVADAIVQRHLRGFDVRFSPGFGAVEERLVVGSAVACARTITPRLLRRLARLRSAYPLSRVILVTELTPEAVASLQAMPALLGQVVWLGRIREDLRQKVEESMSSHFLERAAERVCLLRDPAPPVARFLRVVWTVPRPPSTVKRASLEAGTCPSTFRDRWRELRFAADPKEVVDWGVLGRAGTERETGLPWRNVAYRLGVHERTLGRIADRLLGEPLDAIPLRGSSWLAASFHHWLVGALYSRTHDGAPPPEPDPHLRATPRRRRTDHPGYGGGAPWIAY